MRTRLTGLQRGLHCFHFVLHRRKNTDVRNALLDESRVGSSSGMVKIKSPRNDDNTEIKQEMK